MSTDRQRTFTLEDGQKVTIKSRRLAANRGFFVFINDQKFNCFNKIDRQLAEDSAYVRWVRQQDPGEATQPLNHATTCQGQNP